MTIDIICPLYNAEKFIMDLHNKILSQKDVEINTINYVVTKSNDNTEEILVDMWKNILNINDIGTNEDFFEIGGDSLSAIRLLSNIKNTFNIDISISDIFNNSTIKNLSTFINSHDKSNILKIYRILYFYRAKVINKGKR